MEKELDNLKAHYEYWDEYVSGWLNGKIKTKYLPEPWWGWTPESGLPLRCVVISLHPAAGGSSQERGSIKSVLGQSSYSRAMGTGELRQHLTRTDNWHSSYRAHPILSRLKFPLSQCVANHLSIELSPLHDNTSKNVEAFVKANLDDVVHHTLEFAAAAAREIDGPLNGIVIVRCSEHRFREMFRSSGIQVAEPMPVHGLHLCWFTFPQPQFEDVKFVCLWGARNKIPKKELNQIINHIKQQ